MKKIILPVLFYAVCFSFATGCSKSVKAPVTKTTASANSSTGTQTQNQNQNQQGHTCGGGSSTNNGGHY